MSTQSLLSSNGFVRYARPARSANGVPFLLILVAVSIVLPEEFSFYIFELRFTLTRLIFILLAPLVVIILIQKVRAGRYRFIITDLLVLLSGFWMVYAPGNILGLAAALNHGGPIALEFCMGYFATRMLLSERGQALKFISLFCGLVAVAGLAAALDTFTDSFVVHKLASVFTGYRTYDVGIYRLGLLRARGPFEHPIILGFLSSLALIISFYVKVRWRKFSIAGCSVGTLVAVSTAPVQGFLIGLSLLLYNRILSNIPFKWFALIAAFGAMLGGVWLSGHSILHFVFQYLTFDPESGYYRIWTWDGVSDAVALSPMFGLGFGPFPDDLDINHSIDALWLNLALNFGVPGAILVGLSLVSGAALPISSARFNLSAIEKRLGVALGVVLFVVLFVSFTVDFWGSSWVAVAVLLGVKVHLAEMARIGSRTQLSARSFRKQAL